MFDQIGPGVYRRRYESLDLNVGVVLGVDGVLIVDTRESHLCARELCEELRSLTDLPVRWVVNTHYHWDHTFGNAVFGDAEIWGHELALAALRDHGEEMKREVRGWFGTDRADEIDEVVITPPDHAFSDIASIAIGREIRLTYHGLAHTDGDIVVRVPDADVAFYGDLVEEGAPPSFADSYPIDWPETLRLATEETPAVVVPGHGDVVTPAFVTAQRQELAQVAEVARDLLAGESDLETATRTGPYPPDVMRSALDRARTVA